MQQAQKGSKILDGELSWLFDEARGELGHRGVSIEPAIRGDHEGVSDRQVDSATKYRKIAAALHALSHADQSILRLAHTPLPPGRRAGLAVLGELAAVVVARTDPQKLATALHQSRSRKPGLATVRAKAVAWLAEARLGAFEAVAGAVGRFRAERASQRQGEALARQSRIQARTRGWMGEAFQRETTRVFGGGV